MLLKKKKSILGNFWYPGPQWLPNDFGAYFARNVEICGPDVSPCYAVILRHMQILSLLYKLDWKLCSVPY